MDLSAGGLVQMTLLFPLKGPLLKKYYLGLNFK
jgi:hypothetical protein